MRYEKGHKETTRQHIIDVASREFREGGVAAVGIAGIMSKAGLTNGAFYVHFDSKEDLVRAVLSDALEQRARGLAGNLERHQSLKDSIRDYLSTRHRDHAGSGCPTAALVAEIARHPAQTQDLFAGNVERIVILIAARLRGGTNAERRRKAMAIYGMMVGALQMARAVGDAKFSGEILENALAGAMSLAGED
ncbi:MAG TPA: TetR family transcriptional regulator [Bradyrhizobium sp.]|uniref:TetR/AcrR family transcriptional regulator n=1 Tax=Bradyrhizobium sp. TaxID=376 RepID=UPI002D7F3D8F|nr:TetR family transcriptional regulator [Bradyrhizobium sp.]HET7886060.1 TetR family transcriptional regulator [Bradyrhizobium sp.]